MTPTAARADALKSIDGERAYQDAKWNSETTDSGGKHEVGAFILFMEHHLAKARELVSSHGDPFGSTEAMKEMRKVAALYVAAAEQHGASHRQEMPS